MSHQKGKPMRIKLLILGDQGVGKSAFAVRYVTKRFIGEYDGNKEMLYSCKAMVDHEETQIDLMDTAKEDGFCKSLDQSIRWADGVIIMYSVIDHSSFQTAIQLHSKINKLCKAEDKIPMILVGNKTDLLCARQVTKQMCRSSAKDLGCPVHEISVSESYELVAHVIEDISKLIKQDWTKAREQDDKSVLGSVKRALRKKMYRSKSDTV